MRFNFPRDFYFGAATAAHQVEGNNHNDWTEWEDQNYRRLAQEAESNPPPGGWADYLMDRHPQPIEQKNYISGRGANQFALYEQDFELARQLSHNAHRFSLEWSRIEPREGEFSQEALAHYGRVIDALQARHIEPFVTLWHFTLPIWLAEKGGVLNPNFSTYFCRYVGAVLKELGPKVRFWITFNEPDVYAGQSYHRGIWPPQEKKLKLYYNALTAFIKAHRQAYQLIKVYAAEKQVGIVCNLHDFESGDGIINHVITAIAERVRNYYILNHVSAQCDFIGLNYYFHDIVNYGLKRDPKNPVSDMGWELYPEGLRYVLDRLKKYNKPVYITENGLADATDNKRAWFIRETMQVLQETLRQGYNVRGYFHWSLIDNFEWHNGYWPRFGLVEVNYQSLERTVRPSALVYAEIIKNGIEMRVGKEETSRKSII